MTITEKGQRRRTTRKASDPSVIRVELTDGMGHSRWITADLIEGSEHGIGLSLMTPVSVGSVIVVRGKLNDERAHVRLRAEVRSCLELGNGTFRAGLQFVDERPSSASDPQTVVAIEPGEPDCYEVMQVSPNAEAETIERVYRMLAQRYHPDNSRTGNSGLFIRLTEAHQILTDPVRRASYDARFRQARQQHWNIFDQTKGAIGREAEKRKRQAILELLYAKAVRDPEHSTMSIHAFEELMGCPREHLGAALWYLKGKGYICRSDSGRYTITVQGFDEVEQQGNLPHSPNPQLLEGTKEK